MEATQQTGFGGITRTDIAVAAYILSAVLFFIIPIPSFLLDIMLAVNLSSRKYWICPSSRRCCCLRRFSVFP